MAEQRQLAERVASVKSVAGLSSDEHVHCVSTKEGLAEQRQLAGRATLAKFRRAALRLYDSANGQLTCKCAGNGGPGAAAAAG